MSKIFVILPKYSSYQYKTPEIKDHYSSIAYDKVNQLSAKGWDIEMLAEDMLALKLFKDYQGIQWITSFTRMDIDFMLNCVVDYPEAYKTLSAEHCSPKVIAYLKKCLHMKTIKECRGDMEEYMIARFNYLQDKIRLTVKQLTASYRNILQFVDGNNYCNPAVPSIGDGRFIMTVDLVSAAQTVYYGGCAMEIQQAEQLLEVL